MQDNSIFKQYELIIECCRFQIDNERLEIMSRDIENWDECLNSAYAHGVYPLVTKALKSINNVPESIKSILKQTNLSLAQQNMYMSSELIQVMKQLELAEIDALAIKGPILSQFLYGDVTSRQYSDIDILVNPKDLYKATQLLCDCGYRYDYDMRYTQNKALLTATKDITLTHTTKNILLELHWRLFSGKLFQKSDTEYLVKTRKKIRLNNFDIMTIDDKFLLLYLLLHGSKHLWERIEWIVDIDRLIRQCEPDWEFMWVLAEQMNILPMVQLGCAVVYELFQTPMPLEVLTCLEEASIPNAKDIILQKIRNNDIFEEQQIMNTVYFLGLSKQGKWHEYFVRLLRYTKTDVYSVNVPNGLSWLYYVIHLWNSLTFRLKDTLWEEK